MDKTYQPQSIESDIYQTWEQSGLFSPTGSGAPFSIMLPPPNVTGSLHMGHGFQQTLMDILIRYHRMQGDNTLWQPGTDHAGIATQMVVENQLHAEGKTRYELGRTAFEKKVWEWKAESGGNISRQMRRLGTSPDWSKERFTMDEGLSKAVKHAFISLYKEGLIYRGKRLVNWDPAMLTAVSDLEAIPSEEQGFMWHIRYPLSDGSGHLTIATTRPETMLGDVAVAVHPDDERYQALIGKMLKLPLSEREIPIIADAYVEKEFGTGCVKITPAHDFNDYEIGKRHQLPMINIFTEKAVINENAPQAYQGLERFAARKQVVADLEAQGLLDKVAPHTLKVPRNERGNNILEPYLMDQWYVSTKSLAAPAIAAVKDGTVRFIPENWSNTYFEWMNNIQDWCISRQLWWGHRIPAWYDQNGNIYVGEDEASIRREYKLADAVVLKQDEDVLDTWFSSGLWPFSTLGWPEPTRELATFYPTSVLVTGFDIIFFWVARMMMLGLKFIGKVPFKDIYITGLIRDAEGQKMSKTKGNVLDPIDLIDGIDLDSLIKKRTYGMMQPKLAERVEKATKKEFPAGIAAYGTDALRFTFAALASTSRDICFDVQRMEGYRNFCNKIWNAARFVMMNIEGQDLGHNGKILSPADRWIWHEYNATTAAIHKYLHQYRFDLAAQALYEFIWNSYCDWYLEFTKVVLNDPGAKAEEKAGTRYTLIHVLEGILRLAHPFMPFITEAIWQRTAGVLQIKSPSIMMQAYPQFDASLEDDALATEFTWLKSVIVALRTVRSELNVSPSRQANLLIKNAQEVDKNCLDSYLPLIQSLCRIEQVTWIDDQAELPACASKLIGQLTLAIPLAGLIDVNAEKQRLVKELAKLTTEIARLAGKLNNPSFVDKAPEAVVAKEQLKLAEYRQAQQQLSAQLQKLA